MKRLARLIPLLLAFCATKQSTPPPAPSPLEHGAIEVTILPNPIKAARVSGNTYDFPFEVEIRETGGHPVSVHRVSVDVYALGGVLRVHSESYDEAKIASLGYSTNVPANGDLHYRFNPRKEVPDDRLFGGVTADLRVDATDESGTPLNTRTTVTVAR